MGYRNHLAFLLFLALIISCADKNNSSGNASPQNGGNLPFDTGATGNMNAGDASLNPAAAADAAGANRPGSLASYGLGGSQPGSGLMGQMLGDGGGADGTPTGVPSHVDPATLARAQAFIKAFCGAFGQNAVSPMEAYIVTLYMRILGRLPRRSEVTAMLYSGLDRQGMAHKLLTSTESGILRTYAYYAVFLGRLPDPKASYWVNIMKNGAPWFKASSDAAIIGIVASDEAFNKHGGTNDLWVKWLYRKLLGRDADPAYTYWTGHLNDGSMSRIDVAKGFLTSYEFADKYARKMYRVLLNREGEQSGIDYWRNHMTLNHESTDEIQEGFYMSDEFYSKAAQPVQQAATMACIQGQSLLGN